ncbi:LysR substrate-binding domain-containing protein [soil metagenome]
MNISWLSMRDLQYMVAVANYQHFGKAANHCNVTQPALSAQIKKVEELLGQALFERNNRNVSITPIGQAVIHQAQLILDEGQKLVTLARSTHALLSQSLRLGCIATLGPYLMPHLLAPLRKQYPQLQLFLSEGLTEDLIAQLKAGTLDAVIASPTFDDSGLQTWQLFEEPLYLAVAKEHALATKSPLKASDLVPAEMLLLEDGHCLRDQALALCRANTRGNKQQFQATSLETLRHLVASGMGYTLMPLLAVKQDVKLKNLLLYRSFADKKMSRTLTLYVRERYPRINDMVELVNIIKKNLPEFAPPSVA